jgi:transposase
MNQFSEMKRLLELKLSDRTIAKTLKCRRSTVQAVRTGELKAQGVGQTETATPPPWTLQVNWNEVEVDLKKGFEIKRIWEAYAGEVTSYSHFYKHLRSRFASLFKATVTLRDFSPGDQAEVDYAGDSILWMDQKGEIHKARVFVGVLCLSQLAFAWAAENEKKSNWLLAHRKMLEFFGGVPRVTVCDQLKNGVVKSHLYDPDLNPDYVDLARHYGTAIVPARVRHPKDKALVELSVKLIQRLFKFIYRRHTFVSLEEINEALLKVVLRINEKIHTSFKVSRRQRFEELEKKALQPLPLEAFEGYESDAMEVGDDCTVRVEGNYYSAPHVHRGKKLRVKTTASHVEIFNDFDRVAYHLKVRGKLGERIIDHAHLPENSKCYRETTPQNLLSQARFIQSELHLMLEELFQKDTLGNLRKAQGFIRAAAKMNHRYGKVKAAPWIQAAIQNMRQFNRFRVQEFEEWLRKEAKQVSSSQVNREIVRLPGNPMLRQTTEPQLTVVPPVVNQS